MQARATGYVERLHVRATLDRVAKGQPLLELYVPEWIAAQEEFLSVRRMQGTDLAVLVDGARQRMRQVGMSDEQIRLVEATGATQPRTHVDRADRRRGGRADGARRHDRDGGRDAVSHQRDRHRVGACRSAGEPGRAAASGREGAGEDPGRARRDLRRQGAGDPARGQRGHAHAEGALELANPRGRLVPGMFVQMQFMDMRAEKTLLVPTEAVIQTGRRTVVMLAEENGRFRPVDVEVGIESGGQTEIKRGLNAGQRVVVSSQFLIDSEASLRGVEARLNAEPQPQAAAAAASAPRHVSEAKVEAIGRDAMTLTHGPIPSLKWGPMTMDFKLPPGGVATRRAGRRPSDLRVLHGQGGPAATDRRDAARERATACGEQAMTAH